MLCQHTQEVLHVSPILDMDTNTYSASAHTQHTIHLPLPTIADNCTAHQRDSLKAHSRQTIETSAINLFAMTFTFVSNESNVTTRTANHTATEPKATTAIATKMPCAKTKVLYSYITVMYLTPNIQNELIHYTVSQPS